QAGLQGDDATALILAPRAVTPGRFEGLPHCLIGLGPVWRALGPNGLAAQQGREVVPGHASCRPRDAIPCCWRQARMACASIWPSWWTSRFISASISGDALSSRRLSVSGGPKCVTALCTTCAR